MHVAMVDVPLSIVSIGGRLGCIHILDYRG